MSTVNMVNINNQTGTDLVQDSAELNTRRVQETENTEKLTLAEKLVKAEEVEKAKDQESKQPEAITTEQLEKVAQQLQEFMGEMNKSLEFLVDKDSGRDVIKVLDKGTGELVKQYPSEEVLTLISKLSDATGNLIDTKI